MKYRFGVVRWVATVGILAIAFSWAPGGHLPEAQAQEESWTTLAMHDALDGAIGTAEGDVFGWVLSAAGFGDGDAAALAKIGDELHQIEQTLQGIENDLAVLINAIDQLDCDGWVQDAEPMVDAISNLWDVDENSGDPGDDPPPPQQTYMGIIAETRNNTINAADMQLWVDQVLNNDDKGIGGKSILDHLQDLAHALIPQGGGSGVLKSCLTVPANAPTGFTGHTDDVYYDKKVAPLIDYYFGVQVQGMTMVVDALHYEAWQQAGSPVTGSGQDIANIGPIICGDPSGQVEQFCDNADWAVIGTDGTGGVRARVAAQLALGGAPYTTEDVHLYTGSTVLYVSDLAGFTFTNDPSCKEFTSNDPCGPTVGDYTKTTIAGTWEDRTGWVAADGDQLEEIFTTAPTAYGSSYADVADYLSTERGFEVTSDLVFTTSRVIDVVVGSGSIPGVIPAVCFVDTGASSGKMAPLYCDTTSHTYNTLVEGMGTNSGCPGLRVNVNGANLPASTLNKDFYKAVWCGGSARWIDAPGWTPQGSQSHHQFHLPVIPIATLVCNDGSPATNDGSPATNPAGARSMCGDDLTAWLEAQVPPVPDSVSVAISGRQMTVYVNEGGLLRGDVAVEAGQRRLARVYGVGTIEGIVGDTATVTLDVSRQRSHGRSGFVGTLRIEDGPSVFTSRIAVHDVEQVAPNVVKLAWVDSSQQLRFTVTVKDFAAGELGVD